MFCFYTPQKTSENLWFLCFQGLHKQKIGLKWVKHTDLVFLLITLNGYWPSIWQTFKNHLWVTHRNVDALTI